MARLVFLPIMAFTIISALGWALARYREVQETWRVQATSQPRCRPVLSRPIVMRNPR
jgi:hypothetical protein